MKDDREKPMRRKSLQDGAIDIANVLLKHMVEVADRLVQMETKDESKWRHVSP